MALDASFKAALQADAPTIFHCVELLLPSSVTIRLLDGAGTVTFLSKTFSGLDATYGTVSGIQNFSDGMGAEAPQLTFDILPPSNSAAATLAATAAQGSTVNLWMGAVNVSTGAVIGAPELLFSGVIDVPSLIIGKNTRRVQFDCVSIFERFFEGDEGLEMSNASHQAIWPGETGFDMVTDTERQLPWGSDAPRPSSVTNPATSTPSWVFQGYGGIGSVANQMGIY